MADREERGDCDLFLKSRYNGIASSAKKSGRRSFGGALRDIQKTAARETK